MTREELFDRYVAESLDEEGTAELERLLGEDPEFAASFAGDLLATGLFVQVGSELQRISDGEPAEEPEEVHPHLVVGSEAGALPRALSPHQAPPPPVAALQPSVAPPPPAAAFQQPSPVPPAPGPHPVEAHPHPQQPVLASAKPGSPLIPIVIVLLILGVGGAVIIGLNREPPAPVETAPILARVDSAEGVLMVTHDSQQKKVAAGSDLFAGDLVNAREGSGRIAYANERTYLHLRPGSEVAFGEGEGGKSLRLSLGSLTIEVAPQPVGQPMEIRTDHAIVKVRGTKLTVSTGGGKTFVDVAEGSVTVERKADGASVELGSGSYVNVEQEGPLTAWEFVAGVNLNGVAVEVGGNQWLSHTEAISKGMEVKALDKEATPVQSQQEPLGFLPDAAMRSLLMTSISAPQTRLSIKWPAEKGRYEVLVWIMEDKADKARSLRLNLEEKLVGDELAKDQILGGWDRFGPFPATVADGSLDFLLSADHKRPTRDPHLAGFAVFRAAGALPSLEPEPPAEPPVEVPQEAPQPE